MLFMQVTKTWKTRWLVFLQVIFMLAHRWQWGIFRFRICMALIRCLSHQLRSPLCLRALCSDSLSVALRRKAGQLSIPTQPSCPLAEPQHRYQMTLLSDVLWFIKLHRMFAFALFHLSARLWMPTIMLASCLSAHIAIWLAGSWPLS